MSESGAAAPGPRLRSRSVTRKVARWSTPRALSFGAGLEPIVKESKVLASRVAELAGEVRFTVATKTVAGPPIQHQLGQLSTSNFRDFAPRADAQQVAIEKLLAAGCRLIRRGRFSVTMSGPAELVEDLIGGKLFVQAHTRRTPTPAAQMFASSFASPFPQDLFLAPETSLSVASSVSEAVDHLVFIPPPLYFEGPSPNAPATGFHALDEAQIRQILQVPAGLDGAGVRVAVVDTGFYPHPYYAARGLNLRAVATAGAPHPEVDDYGHGTAITYNVFAVAPGVEVLGFRQTDPPQDALEDAADAGVDIISCSWGWDREQLFPVLQASLLSIIAEGKVVLFAAGNGHYAWPGSEPDVLSIGGVYSDNAQQLQASDYASGYMSGMWPNRRVPDVCGLCGQRPKAIYIMMPTQPGNTMDTENGGQGHPYADESGKNDGWVGASGTSSATPQVAGVVALMVQKAKALGVPLSPGRVKQILEATATPIAGGRNAMGFPAQGHPNTATGWGLVNAGAALDQILAPQA